MAVTYRTRTPEELAAGLPGPTNRCASRGKATLRDLRAAGDHTHHPRRRAPSRGGR